MLTPIEGYLNYPLVSLGEALKPVSVLFKTNELQRSIDEAYQRCHYPSAALYLYSMEAGEHSLYQHLNRILRDEDRRKTVPLDVSEEYQKVTFVTWPSFSSCPALFTVVKEFLKPNQDSTLFMIEAVDGKRGQ